MARKKTMNDTGTRNLDKSISLFGDLTADLDIASSDEKSLLETNKLETKYIDRSDVIDNQQNRFAVTNTYFLEQSILKLGQLQPILVVHLFDENGLPTGKYEIKAGSRRFKAINNICEKAKKDGNMEVYDKFNKLYVTILPMGITDEEVDRVITETNTTTRQISIEDLFKNFDIVFERDENGDFKYISKGSNKYEEGSNYLKQLGYSFSKSSVKDYLTIYLAQNPKIRENFEKGFLGKRQSLIVARMDAEDQEEALNKFDNMLPEEITKYLNEYTKNKKEKKRKSLKGIEVITDINKMKTNISNQKKKEIIFIDQMQKEKCISDISILMEELENFVKLISEIEI